LLANGEWRTVAFDDHGHRRKGVLHRLLDAAKKMSDVVIIPEPMNVVPLTAAKHGYVEAKQWIEDYNEFINVMEWRR
jgi:hypothetical protein